MKSKMLMGALVVSLGVCAAREISENMSLTADTDWRNEGPVTIASGVTLLLNGHSLAVSGLAGEGMIADTPELVANGSFETLSPAPGKTTWSYFYTSGSAQATGWTWTREEGDGPGQTANGTPWLSVAPTHGARACFIQGNTSISQIVTVSRAGGYRLSFDYVGRPSYTNLRIHIVLDGEELDYVDCVDTTAFARKEVACDLTAGEHTLTFRGDAQDFSPTSYRCACIDSVSLKAVGASSPDMLTIEVPEGTTTTNASVTIAGNVKLVKEGAGTLVAARLGQTYTGGTDVRAGTLLCGVKDTGWSGNTYGKASCVTVRTGATFDLAGFSNAPQKLVLDGGLAKSEIAAGAAFPCFTEVVLTDDSSISGLDLGIIHEGWTSTSLEMNGHTLNVNVPVGGEFSLCNTTVTGGGRIVVDGGGEFWFGNSRSLSTVSAVTTAFEFRNASICTYGGWHNVGDYISSYAGDTDEAAANTGLRVHGRFAPAARWHACELQPGAVLDLSQVTGTWTNTCPFVASGTQGAVSFTTNGTVTVDCHGRTLESEELLINWLAAPPLPNISLAFDAVTAAAGVLPVASEVGLHYGADVDSSIVHVAHWTGAGRAGDITDPSNWACSNVMGRVVTDGVPNANALVYIGGSDLNLQIPPSSPIPYARLVLGDVTLAADCDWRGLGADVPINATIDLRGHTLQLANLLGAASICDTTAPASENLIRNGSFESWSGALTKTTWTYLHTSGAAIPADWSSWSRDVANNAGPGLAVAGSPWYNGNPTDGTMAAFLQGFCTLSQTVEIPEDGVYLFSFDYIGRKSFANLRLHVEVDDLLLSHVDATDTTAFKRQTFGLFLTAGTHTLTIRGDSQDYAKPIERCAAIDNLSLQACVGGSLVLDLAEGVTCVNSTIPLTGNFSLVKRGPGTYVAAKAGQTYQGRTLVEAGTFKAGFRDTTFSGFAYGFGSRVEVSAGAVFDLDGWPTAPNVLYLHGGTIKNSTARSWAHQPGLLGVVLTADSRIELVESLAVLRAAFGTTRLELGDHVLTVQIPNGKFFELCNSTVLGTGRIIAQGGGRLLLGHNGDVSTVERQVNAPEATIELEDAWLEVGVGTKTVGGYLAHYTGTDNTEIEGGRLLVTKRFEPGSKWHSCELQNGVTLDLNAYDGVWTGVCTFTEGGPQSVVSYVTNAAITIDIHARRFVNGQPIMTWNTPPLATFQIDAQSRARGCYLIRTDEGLFFGSGLIIYVR